MNPNRSTKMQQVIVTTVELTDQDGYSWRKYGQKLIVNAKHPREYYRCGHKDQGCKATKQVQIVSENPTRYKITYLGKHTCKCRPMDASNFDISDFDSPNMLSFNDTDKSVIRSHRDFINELAILDASRKTKGLQTNREMEERLKRPEELDLRIHMEPNLPKADAGSATSEAICKVKQKEALTEEMSSIEEIQGDTNFQPIDDINLPKESTSTSSDQVLPHASQDVVGSLSRGSDALPSPLLDRVGHLHIANSLLRGTKDENVSLNNCFHCFMSDIDKDIVKGEGKKRKIESVVLSLTENYIRTVNTVVELMEENESSTSNQLVEDLEAKVELLKKRAEDAEAKLEKEQAAWQRAKDRFERRTVDAENDICNLEKKLDEAWTEKAELKASVAAATEQMKLKCVDLMKRALAKYDNKVSWNHVLRHFLYLEQQSDNDTPEADPSNRKNQATGSTSHLENNKNICKENDAAVREDEANSAPEYSLHTLTMTKLAL